MLRLSLSSKTIEFYKVLGYTYKNDNQKHVFEKIEKSIFGKYIKQDTVDIDSKIRIHKYSTPLREYTREYNYLDDRFYIDTTKQLDKLKEKLTDSKYLMGVPILLMAPIITYATDTPIDSNYTLIMDAYLLSVGALLGLTLEQLTHIKKRINLLI